MVGLFKIGLIRRRGPWRGVEDVEFATLEYVPPAGFEQAYHNQEAGPDEAVQSRLGGACMTKSEINRLGWLAFGVPALKYAIVRSSSNRKS